MLETIRKLFNIVKPKKAEEELTELGKVYDQMRLKLKDGGLGIIARSSLITPAYLASLAAAIPSLSSLFTSLGSDNPRSKKVKETYEIHFGKLQLDIKQRSDATSLNRILPSSADQIWNHFRSKSASENLQAKLAAAIYKKQRRSLLLQVSPSVPSSRKSIISSVDKARLLSASHPAAKLWLTTVPEEKELRLSDDEFRAAIKNRLSLPTASA